MIRPLYLLPLLNVSLFSGLLVCQLVDEQALNPWMLAICAVGAVGNLGWLFVLSRDEPGGGSRENDLRSEDKSAIMSDLDKEIERRREIEKVEKN
jgi:hypothetical protein